MDWTSNQKVQLWKIIYLIMGKQKIYPIILLNCTYLYLAWVIRIMGVPLVSIGPITRFRAKNIRQAFIFYLEIWIGLVQSSFHYELIRVRKDHLKLWRSTFASLKSRMELPLI